MFASSELWVIFDQEQAILIALTFENESPTWWKPSFLISCVLPVLFLTETNGCCVFSFDKVGGDSESLLSLPDNKKHTKNKTFCDNNERIRVEWKIQHEP